MLKALVIFAVCITQIAFAQDRKVYFPIWTFHQNDIIIDGISIGLASFQGHPKNTDTNGIKIELIGGGLILPLLGKDPIAETEEQFAKIMEDSITEKINGLALSGSGTICDCIVNGISLGSIGQILTESNGLSISAFNSAQIQRGLHIGVTNETYELHGVQIGAVNTSYKTKGIQIGLWNVNEKRKLPFINWSF